MQMAKTHFRLSPCRGIAISAIAVWIAFTLHPLTAQTTRPSIETKNLPHLNAANLETAGVSNNMRWASMRGVVLSEFSPRCWFAYDEAGAFRVELEHAQPLRRGQMIIVVGRPVMREGRPWLEQAEAKAIGVGKIPIPRRVRVPDAVTADHDGQYVTLTGKVVGYGDYVNLAGTNEAVLLNSDGIFCKAILPAGTHSAKLFKLGTIADFTGVLRYGNHVDGAPPNVHHVHVVLHGPDAVRVIWTNTASWMVSALIATVVFVVVAWILFRWRKARLLRASELRFRALIENSFDITLVLNPDLSIKYASPSAERILGGRWKDKSMLDVVHPDDRQLISDVGKEVMRSPGSSRRIDDHRIAAPDGKLIHAAAIATNCLNVPGVEGIVINVRDVTERKRAEEELRQVNAGLELRVTKRTTQLREANERLQAEVSTREQAEENLRISLAAEKELSQLKSSFVSMVSHEFRTPLEVILSSSDILDRYFDRLPPEKRAAQLRAVRKSVRRMNDLIDDVLLLGKFDAGVLACNPSQVDLTACCRRAIAEIESASMRSGAIQFTAKDINGEATADEGLMLHILTNVLGNGLKYSPPGQTLEFTVTREGLDAEFVIRDHGCGIPAADLPRLFTAFYRGSNVGQTSGSGLGLVITKRCVDLHCGRIRCESTEGVGTTFTIHLPVFDGTRYFRRTQKNAFSNP